MALAPSASHPVTRKHYVGTHLSVPIHVAAWDATEDAEISGACLFTHEATGSDLGGEILFINSLPKDVAGQSLLIIGLRVPTTGTSN